MEHQYRSNMCVGLDVQRKRLSQPRWNALGRGERQFHPRTDTIRGRCLDLGYNQACNKVSQEVMRGCWRNIAITPTTDLSTGVDFSGYGLQADQNALVV